METLKQFIKNHKVLITFLFVLLSPIIFPLTLLVAFGWMIYYVIALISQDW